MSDGEPCSTPGAVRVYATPGAVRAPFRVSREPEQCHALHTPGVYARECYALQPYNPRMSEPGAVEVKRRGA